MKVRQGFVSNSSSSSFIAVGIKVSDVKLPDSWDEETKEKFYDNLDYGSDGFIGHQICYGVEDEGLVELSLDKISEYKTEVIKELTDKGLTFKEEDIKLLYGNLEN